MHLDGKFGRLSWAGALPQCSFPTYPSGGDVG
uniref:Uncharacterized protein n=1 Tax=Heterorhabditis bacteriophora TaxID=37862 RepID=A0A1I7W795_HETBA